MCVSHDTCTPYTPATNGVAERAVRRVKEGTSASLVQSGLSDRWWHRAIISRSPPSIDSEPDRWPPRRLAPLWPSNLPDLGGLRERGLRPDAAAIRNPAGEQIPTIPSRARRYARGPTSVPDESRRGSVDAARGESRAQTQPARQIPCSHKAHRKPH